MERTLDIKLRLLDNERFEVIIRDNESGLSETFTQDTPEIESRIGVEVMSWLDMMTYEEE